MKHYTKLQKSCQQISFEYILERIFISINWLPGCVIGYEDSALIGNSGKFCDFDNCLMQCACNGFQSYFG